MAVLWFLLGGVVEVLNTFTRRWSVLHISARRPRQALVLVIGGMILRAACTAVLLMLAFRHSLLSGGMAFLGYWVCRWVMVLCIDRFTSSDRLV